MQGTCSACLYMCKCGSLFARVCLHQSSCREGELEGCCLPSFSSRVATNILRLTRVLCMAVGCSYVGHACFDRNL